MLEYTLYRINLTSSRIKNWVPQSKKVFIVQSTASRNQLPESSIQGPASRVQRPTLASRVQKFWYAGLKQVKREYSDATDIITKCDSYFITKCDTSVIQNVTVFLQNATVIKNCNKTIIVQVKRKKEIYIPVHCRYHPITNIGFISQTQTFPRATGEGGERL